MFIIFCQWSITPLTGTLYNSNQVIILVSTYLHVNWPPLTGTSVNSNLICIPLEGSSYRGYTLVTTLKFSNATVFILSANIGSWWVDKFVSDWDGKIIKEEITHLLGSFSWKWLSTVSKTTVLNWPNLAKRIVEVR